MDDKELFENFCFLPDWSEIDEDVLKAHNKYDDQSVYMPQRKDLPTLLAELEQIKNNIKDIKAREWHLAKLMKFHRQGLPAK